MGIKWCQGLIHRAHFGALLLLQGVYPIYKRRVHCGHSRFHPQSSKLPHISAVEVATHAAKDLSAALTGPDTNAPFAALGDDQLQAIHQLTSIFRQQHKLVIMCHFQG
eukprot:10273035-Ditylum_brightwellii.AAC.1